MKGLKLAKHEINMLQFLANKNLCAKWSICIIDKNTINDDLRIVMEYVDGYTLLE